MSGILARDADLPAYLAAVERFGEPDSWLAYAAAVFDAAELLLRRNFALICDDLDRLLAFRSERDTEGSYAGWIEGLNRVMSARYSNLR